MTVVDVRGLVAGYGQMAVVRGLDLHVEEGEVVALFGPNGAGKTTTLSTIAGVLSPLGGSISVCGHSTAGRSVHKIARLGLALVPEDRGLFSQLTVAEHFKVHRRAGDPPADEVLAHFPALGELMRRRAGLLSGGEQQMLALACALVARPRVLLVDELSLGLAPTLVEGLLDLVRRSAEASGMAVLLVEQHLGAALAVVDRGYVISRGRVVLSGSASELRGRPDLLEAGYLGDAALR
jgi:branched-chain amino acid transport system ATP-binding protein